jgi:hypothetical protein
VAEKRTLTLEKARELVGAVLDVGVPPREGTPERPCYRLLGGQNVVIAPDLRGLVRRHGRDWLIPADL